MGFVRSEVPSRHDAVAAGASMRASAEEGHQSGISEADVIDILEQAIEFDPLDVVLAAEEKKLKARAV